MIKNDLLKCIYCGNDILKVSPDKNILTCTKCDRSYPIRNGIPILISQQEHLAPAQSEIHKKQGTQFNYIEHYQQDAIDFDYFQVRDAGTEHSERRVREYILAQMPVKTGTILDIGCGKAWVAQNCCSMAKHVVSMDISLTNVEKARKKYTFENHSGVVADSLKLPFKENSFDYIIASEIIEHVVYPDVFVQGLLKILKPGGKLLVTTPYKEKLQYSLCIHCNNLTPRHAHIHSFDEKKLENLYKGNVTFKYKTFGNKILIHLRTYVFLKFLSFKLWKFADSTANIIYQSPTTIYAEWTKPGNS